MGPETDWTRDWRYAGNVAKVTHTSQGIVTVRSDLCNVDCLSVYSYGGEVSKELVCGGRELRHISFSRARGEGLVRLCGNVGYL